MKRSLTSALHTFLLVEWPLLAVALALTAWGLSSVDEVVRFQSLRGTPKGAESGQFGFNYGTQVITRTSTQTSTSTNDQGGATTITKTTTYPYSLYPYQLGTSEYASIYSSIGSIPPPVKSFTTSGVLTTNTLVSKTYTSIQTVALPTSTPEAMAARRRTIDISSGAAMAKRKRSWQEPSSSNSRGLFRGNDTPSLIPGARGCFAALVALLAIRILLTPAFVFFTRRQHDDGKGLKTRDQEPMTRSWHLALCVVTAITFFCMLAIGLGIWIPLGYIYSGVLADSPAMQATIAFYAITIVTSFVVVVMSSVALRRVDKQRANALDNARQDDGGKDTLMRESSE